MRPVASTSSDLREHRRDDRAVERLHRCEIEPPEAVLRAHQGRCRDLPSTPLWRDIDHDPKIEMDVVDPSTTRSGEALTTGKIPIRSAPIGRTALEPERRDGEVAQLEETIHPPGLPPHHLPRRMERVQGFGNMDGVGIPEIGTGEKCIDCNGWNASFVDDNPPQCTGTSRAF